MQAEPPLLYKLHVLCQMISQLESWKQPVCMILCIEGNAERLGTIFLCWSDELSRTTCITSLYSRGGSSDSDHIMFWSRTQYQTRSTPAMFADQPRYPVVFVLPSFLLYTILEPCGFISRAEKRYLTVDVYRKMFIGGLNWETTDRTSNHISTVHCVLGNSNCCHSRISQGLLFTIRRGLGVHSYAGQRYREIERFRISYVQRSQNRQHGHGQRALPRW